MLRKLNRQLQAYHPYMKKSLEAQIKNNLHFSVQNSEKSRSEEEMSLCEIEKLQRK